MNGLWENMMFGVCLTAFAYWAGKKINKRIPSPLTNPLVLSIILTWTILKAGKIPYESYMEGGQIYNMLIMPATAAVGLSVFRQAKVLKREFFPVLLGSLAACVCSMGSVWLLGNLLGLDRVMIVSLFPKSVTTAIALDVCGQLGGNQAVTMLAVVLSGALGSVFNTMLVKALRLKNPVAVGVAMGCTSHAIGTSRAVEMGEIQGAVSGVCIGTAGLLTAVIAIFL